MAQLEILHFPDERLRHRCVPVDDVNDETRQLIDNMFETMYAADGIGLAAAQVNVPLRVMVIDLARHENQQEDSALVFINPEIIDDSGSEVMEEGCLSVPDTFAKVERAETIKVRALDREGVPFELEADGLLAVCIQHEIDHLDGKLFVDYLSPLKRDRIRKKLLKLRHRNT